MMAVDSRFEQAVKLAEKYGYEQEHSHNVLGLSEQLFDELAEVHWQGDGERELVRCGAVLHDIGWVMGRKGHHKCSARFILEDETVGFSKKDRMLVAMIARYHRKSLPDEGHDVYSELKGGQRRLVWLLGGIVRLADGLDRMHSGVVSNLNCRIDGDIVDIDCDCRGFFEAELEAGNKKKAMLEKALNKKITLHMAY